MFNAKLKNRLLQDIKKLPWKKFHKAVFKVSKERFTNARSESNRIKY